MSPGLDELHRFFLRVDAHLLSRFEIDHGVGVLGFETESIRWTDQRSINTLGLTVDAPGRREGYGPGGGHLALDIGEVEGGRGPGGDEEGEQGGDSRRDDRPDGDADR